MNARSESLWEPRKASKLSGVELCAYASRLIGEDPRLVLWGGGNSSVKTTETDHTGKRVKAVWVKASGHDMKTISAEGFTPLRLDELLSLRARRVMSDEEMTAYFSRCSLDPKAAKPSIETLMHSFVPATHVYHTHADAVAGFTCAPGSLERTRKAFGGKVLWVPYVRPGFQLGKYVAEALLANPKAHAMILDKHGALTWGENAEEAYEEMISLTRKALAYQTAAASRRLRASVARSPIPSSNERQAIAAKILPWIRGEASKFKRVIVRWDDSPETLNFLARPDAEQLSQLGPFSPDHTLQTKARPLFWKLDGRASIQRAFERYRRWYQTYYQHHAPKDTPWMDPNPRVILVPDVGLFTTGRDWAKAGIPQEIYRHTIEVVARVSAFSRYEPLDLRHLGDLEFWPMETYKYRLLPPEAEFSRRVVFITGAAGAIGAAAAESFCLRGAHAVLADLDLRKAEELAQRLNSSFGNGAALAVSVDVGSEASVKKAFEQAVLKYGGIDVLFSNAGIAKSSSIEDLTLVDWEKNLRVNATGHFLCAREAMRVFKSQGIGGAVVLNASKNVLAPGKEFAAYSASKAASVQLARVLAIEAGEHGVRVNIVNPDAVFEGSGLWSPEMRRGRAKAQGIPVASIEEHYAARNILKAKVTAFDVAEAVLFLASDRSAKTTGALLPVDGGLREAFPR